MPRNGLVGFGRVTAFHPSGNAHELLDVGLAFFRGELRVAPVVNYGAYHHHHAACAGEILLGAESAVFQGVKHVRDGRTGGLLVAFGEIVQCIQLHPARESAHLEVVAVAAVFFGGVFFRCAGNGELVQPCDDLLSFRRCHAGAEVVYSVRTDVEPGMFNGGQRHAHAVHLGPYNFGLLPFLRLEAGSKNQSGNCREYNLFHHLQR